MRIIDKASIDGVWCGDTKPSPLPPLDDSVLVACDDVAAWYWTSTQQIWNFDADFGPLIPPFDSMVVQWSYPARIWIDGSWENAPVTEGAALIRTSHSADGHSVAIQSLYAIRGRIVMPLAGVVLNVSNQGQLVGEPRAVVDPRTLADPTPEQVGNIVSSVHVPMLAISLMHCKNVGLTDGPAVPNDKRRKRAGLPERTMTTVRLPRAMRQGGSTTRDTLGQVQPLHLVRGHFKTYTDDKPLFGKHSGTYWWSWQARGDEEAGERAHNYEVGP